MSKESNFLDIHLLGKEYRVACEPEHREALLEAAAIVDARMRALAEKSRNNQPERLAVMTALNIAHEFLAQNKSPHETHEKIESAEIVVDFASVRGRISHMEAELAAVLQAGQLADS
ncbi:MAG TPA: cell division protein ZapA [Accumulibacter sp.]|nr:cell division protein ZapA [Accumulibacter sp.]HMW16577.1 cell division protein ZapA [Accumulibacter sp.]HMX22740.1 cell division protein ZapA [Accumulibacter sp.]HNC17492.1 cell division protein ZapA [Accumulibacter sp.]HND79162.1 cell division protein ZapA [Accumulibacter sp.]